MIKNKIANLALLSCLLAPMAANADIITFDPLGDGVDGTDVWNTIYDTSEVDVQLTGSRLCSWDTGYGDLNGTAYTCNDNGFIIIDFVALNGSTVYLDSFDWANWLGNGGPTGWAVYDIALGALSGVDPVSLVYDANTHYTVDLGYASTTGFRLQINPDNYNNGLDNVVFRGVPVSAPGTLALLGLGLAGVSVARRRKKV